MNENIAAHAIAIVGMACRFPAAPDLDSYWRLLCAGVEAVGPVPVGRPRGTVSGADQGKGKITIGDLGSVE